MIPPRLAAARRAWRALRADGVHLVGAPTVGSMADAYGEPAGPAAVFGVTDRTGRPFACVLRGQS